MHIDAIIKTSDTVLRKIYLSLYLKGLCERESWRPNRTATYWPPQPLRTSPCVVLVLLSCSTRSLRAQPLWGMFSSQHLLTNWSPNSVGGPEGPICLVVAFSTTPCLQLVWPPTHWLPADTELYNSSIAHSISILMASQAGICHFRRLWTDMFDHHRAEITVMQFRGHSLPVHQSMRVSWDFTLSHFVRQARLRDFFT